MAAAFGDEFEYLGGPGGERGVAGIELDDFAGLDALSHLPLELSEADADC
ncbi:MAG TPA: hypothetical protein VNW74_12555 [Mycobacterium sp.]|jgi:hypothetical protein|nr:hypothetical protein [Mycobacterium sp.]